MRNKLFLLYSLVVLFSSHASASEWVKSDLYKNTQSTYIDDIDAINISMGSMDKSCWGNLPYGAPYIITSRSISITHCGVLSGTIVDKLNKKLGLKLHEIISKSADFVASSNASPISTLIDIATFDMNKPKLTNTALKILNSISSEFKRSQVSLNINGSQTRYAPPQVVDLVTFTGKDNKIARLYIVSLDAISKTQNFYLINSDGSSSQIGEKAFREQTYLVMNPLYKR